MKTMKISKPLSIILLIVMILSLMPTSALAEGAGEDAVSPLSSGGEPIVINEISATVTAPEPGKAPKDMSASAPDGANYTVRFFRCCDYDPVSVMPADATFNPDTYYDVDILVVANPGYEISETASIQINGDASIDAYRSGTFGNEIMYSMDFHTAAPPAPPSNVIDNMAASITFPVAGQCPSDTGVSSPDDANYTVEFYRCRYRFNKVDNGVNKFAWDVPMDEPLEADKTYTVEVLVGAKPGYEISEEATLRVNGDYNIYCGRIATVGDKILYSTSYIPKAPVDTINRIVTSVTRPVAGGKPTDVQVLVADNLPYTGEVMAWSVGDTYQDSDAMYGNFEAGKTYWANIKFDVKTGSNSKFANSIDIIVESDGVEKNSVQPDGSYAEIVLKFVIPASEPETVDIHVNKVWLNENGDPVDWPEGQIVDVILLKNGEPSDIQARIVDNTGTEFLSFPKFDPTGREIEYTVDEVNVPNGYTHEVTLDTTGNFIITNTKTPESADYATITVRKEWKDGAGNAITPPVDSVEVEILNGEEIVEVFSVSKRNQWTNSMNLPAKDSNGNPVNYTVKEANVPDGFESAVSGTLQDGFTITNIQEHRYLLHYDANGGKNPPVDSSETNALGFAEMYVSSDKPTKKDMVFTGWATSKDGKAVYHAGDKITLTLDNDSITLYAAWAKPTDKPKTGDESNVLLWTSLAIASLAGCAALFAYSKKRHKA